MLRVVLAALIHETLAWTHKSIVREMTVRPNGLVEVNTVYDISSRGTEPYKLSVADIDKVGIFRVLSNGKEISMNDVLVSGAGTFIISPSHIGDSIQVRTFQGDMLEPYPKKIMEIEVQKVLLVSSALVPTEYPTDSQKTTVAVPKDSELYAVGPSGSSKRIDENKVEIGPFSSEERNPGLLRVHFKLDIPLLVLESAEKTIELSHLGQAVSVSEELTLRNRGAAVDGEFNRVPHAHLKYSGDNVPFRVGHTLTEVDAIVPVNAFDIHYRDVIGNISSSAARRESDLTRVSLRPRFPLLGGWKTEFSFLFNIPFSGDYVHQDSDEYLLTVPLGHSLAGVFARQMVVNIILPAGVSDISVSVPGRHVEELTSKKSFGWLDSQILGERNARTLVTLKMGPFVAGESNSVRPGLFITYKLPVWALLKAPLLMTVYILSLFVLFIMSRRMVMQISNPKETLEEEMKNADHDLCGVLEDQLSAIWVLTGELLELAADGSNKAELNKCKDEFSRQYDATLVKVRRISSQFNAEHNRVDRTNRLLNALKTVRENAIGVLDTALNGKDYSSQAGRLMDAEAEVKIILDKVESGASKTPPGTPLGSTASSSKAPTALKKRR
jgi:oligosaccharyltransferase complex subunit alpha (ribophorin I)